VKVEESIRGFKEILEGKHDDVPERAFFMKGSIDEVVADAGGKSSDSDSDSGSDSDSDSDGSDSEENGSESKE
jgi:hypothetical protein